MSGVNAHMLLRACRPDLYAAVCSLPLVWKTARVWPGPFLHHFALPSMAGLHCRVIRSAMTP